MNACISNGHLDTTDLLICVKRKRAFRLPTNPQVGDRVIFADGVRRRISYVWRTGPTPEYQTSDGGSFYLGPEDVNFSGSLHRPVSETTLSRVDEEEYCPFWFFSHDEWRAHNGVWCSIPVRVWQCSLASTVT